MLTNRRRDPIDRWGVRALLLAGVLTFAATGRANSLAIFGAATDLDGDRVVDIATAGQSRPDGAGYLLDISIRLGAVQTRAITVHTSRAPSRIFARDIDGDSDRDLIVESFDREPIAVLLNDGNGEFHQAAVEDFGSRLRRPGKRSADTPARDDGSLDTLDILSGPADADAPSSSEPSLLCSPFAAPTRQLPVVLRHAAPVTRGPPSSL